MMLQTENMTWEEIDLAIKNGFDTIIIAVGSIEQHGKHLPTKTDSLIGEEVVREVVKKLGNALQGPTIRLGCSKHHLGFPGTITLETETFKAVIRDYVMSLSKHNFKNVVFLPSHGGNFQPLKESIAELQPQYPNLKLRAYTDLYGFIELLNGFSIEEGVSAEEAGAHSGENETSIVLALAEELVKKEKFDCGFVGTFGPKEGEIVMTQGIKALSPNGVLGDPRKASVEKGTIYFNKMVDFFVKKVQEFIAD
ncbi:MAG: creatininase family protein [Candidatus Heimdallarchaeota archaeon]|nr:creatininase family protein [Candidatus Heimdallarchaeota archaeon]